MRTLKLLVLSAIFAALAALPAAAIEAPHDGSFNAASCDGCHMLHGSTGGTLLGLYSDNNASCIGCHFNSASSTQAHDLKNWNAADQGTPGTSGIHHKWDADAVNLTLGTTAPADADMARVTAEAGGKIQCSTCHDQHGSPSSPSKANAGTAPFTSPIAPLTNAAPTGGTYTGSATMRITTATSAATAQGYRIVLVRQSSTTFKIAIQADDTVESGYVAYWWNYVGSAWAKGDASGGAGGTVFAMGNTVTLGAGTPTAGITVTFAGTLNAGDAPEWKFYVSYPFLRASNSISVSPNGICVQCHADRVMGHGCVDGTDCAADGRYFSHPVGEALGTNTGLQDLTSATMLDADGTAQNAGTGDGIVTNNIPLGAGGVVGCLSCHAPHNADSNSLTADKRSVP